jgi:hypothetical protein
VASAEQRAQAAGTAWVGQQEAADGYGPGAMTAAVGMGWAEGKSGSGVAGQHWRGTGQKQGLEGIWSKRNGGRKTLFVSVGQVAAQQMRQVNCVTLSMDNHYKPRPLSSTSALELMTEMILQDLRVAIRPH